MSNMADLIWSCCTSDQEKSQRLNSRIIDRSLAREKQQFKRTVKVLLLGAGESGKSTFIKQMRIIHGQDFDEDALKEFKSVIYTNIVKGMRVLIDARDKLAIPWGNDDSGKLSRIVFAVDSPRIEEDQFLHYVDAIKYLWKDSGILQAFSRRREFQLGDSLKYFLDNLERIGQSRYIPLRLDVLHARKATKGIIEHRIDTRGIPFLFVDVGGQRSQRQKWFQCFESVTSILFMASSSEFDQVLLEDRSTNRLAESCGIFDTIVNNKSFVRVSVILFLNKTDLLREKIRDTDIGDYFPDFDKDPRRLEDVQLFLLTMFDGKRRSRSRPLFHHFTTAVDTENIKFVFQAVKDTILQDNLKSLMLQ